MSEPILIVGGGTWRLVRSAGARPQRLPTCVCSRSAPEFGVIGYGIQLGPNVFSMLDRLGVTDAVLAKSIRPNACVELDALDRR